MNDFEVTSPGTLNLVDQQAAEIERLRTEVANLKLANDEARKSLDGNVLHWSRVLRELEEDILRRLREIPEDNMYTAPLGCSTSAVCAAFHALDECRASSGKQS